MAATDVPDERSGSTRGRETFVPVPEGERVRAALRLLDAPVNPALQRLAEIAARRLAATASQVSLLTDVQTITAVAGQDTRLLGVTAPAHESLCTVTARLGEPLVVANTAADERVASLPPVLGGTVGAYLGVPLIGHDEHVVGALCVFGPEPRQWSDADVHLLSDLARTAVTELELSAAAVQQEADRTRWQLAVAAGGVGSFDWDLRTGRLAWDERARTLFGGTDGRLHGTVEDFTTTVHPDDLAKVTSALDTAVTTCGSYDAEYRVVLPGGDTRWVAARGEALAGASGQAVRVLGVVYDTTLEKDTDARVARVLESMPAAFYSLDRQWRFTHLNAEAERLLQRDRGDLLGRVIWELFPGAAGTDVEEQYRRAARHRQPVRFEAHYPSPLDAWFEVRAWPGPDGLAVYFLDVTARRTAQQQAETERQSAQEALRASERARRAAEEARRAAEQARRTAELAQQQARQAQDAAESTASRLQLLARVSADLSATLDPRETVARLAPHLVPAVGDWCVISLLDPLGTLRDVGSWHADEAVRPVVERYVARRLQGADHRAAFTHRALSTRATVLVPAPASEAIAAVLHDPRARELIHQLAPHTAAIIPLRARGETIGLITLYRSAGRSALAGEDLMIAEEVAERAALALDNARLFGQQQRLAEGLQRSMLTAPVEPDHLQVAVRYRPSARAARVGGDWYDAFLQPDGATVLVIGDVMGHDVEAAAAMGQVRNLLRGIAHYSGEAPAAVLSGLDAAMQGLAVDTTATAVVARLEQDHDERERGVTRLRWSNAGHPPPMLLTPDGTVTALTGLGHDLLLGIAPGAPRIDEEVAVDRGSTVLLYSDGLIERRGQDYSEGLLQLRGVITELAKENLEDLCDEVLRRMLPERPEDDVALVAVRLHPQDRPRPAEAGPHVVPPGVDPEAEC